MNYIRYKINQIQWFGNDQLYPLLSCIARIWVAYIFFKSGLTKIQDWGTTLALFTDEYKVPLQPYLAKLFDVMLPSSVLAKHDAASLATTFFAGAGTFGELVFPVMLAFGIFGRFSAFSLFMVNLMAMVSYPSALFPEGFEIAQAKFGVLGGHFLGIFYQTDIGFGLYQHLVWGGILLACSLQGVGKFSIDHLFNHIMSRKTQNHHN